MKKAPPPSVELEEDFCAVLFALFTNARRCFATVHNKTVHYVDDYLFPARRCEFHAAGSWNQRSVVLFEVNFDSVRRRTTTLMSYPEPTLWIN